MKVNWFTFPILSLIHFIISPSAILSSLYRISSFSPPGSSATFLISYSILSAFPAPWSSLPSSVPHNFASYPFSPSLSLIMSFSSLSSDIAIYYVYEYDYTSSEYSCVFGHISLFSYAYICVFYLCQLLWYSSVHSGIKRYQSALAFGSFRYLG